MKKYLFLLFFFLYILKAEISIFDLKKDDTMIEDTYDYYQNERYELPPSLEEIRKNEKKSFDFGVGIDIDKEKKELNSLELDMGIKF